MKMAIAISAMIRNVLSVAAIPPTTVTASQMTTIALRIVPMIRPMYPVCACTQYAPGSPGAGGGRAPSRAGPGPGGPPGLSGRDGAWSLAVTGPAGAGHAMIAGPRPKADGNRRYAPRREPQGATR